jgi:rhodanese-related sulfurtransferase
MPNKKFFRAGLAILCFCAASYSHAADDATQPEKMAESDIHAMMETGTLDYLIFDMRENLDYVAGHIPGANSLPMRMLEKRISEIPRDKPVLLVFRNAGEAGEACKLLVDNGHNPEHIKILDDDMEQWMKSGYAVEDAVIRDGCC